jgi:hypothetical protein
MNDQITSLFAFLNSAKVKEKYELYRNGGGCITGTYLPKSKIGFKITDAERETICKKYQNGTPIVKIAEELGRSQDSMRNVLKKAGLYIKGRDSVKSQFENYKTTKTVKTK